MKLKASNILIRAQFGINDIYNIFRKNSTCIMTWVYVGVELTCKYFSTSTCY